MFCVHAGIFVTELIQLGLESHKLEGEQEGILTSFWGDFCHFIHKRFMYLMCFKKKMQSIMFLFFPFFFSFFFEYLVSVVIVQIIRTLQCKIGCN